MILRLATGRQANLHNAFTGFAERLARKIRYSFPTLAIALLLPLLAWPQPTQSSEGLWSKDGQSREDQSIAPRNPTSPNFQGLILHWFQPWPTVPFHTFRLWDRSEEH